MILTRRDKATTYALLTVAAALLSAPFLFMVSMSLSSDATAARSQFSLLPHEFVFGNFVRAFTSNVNVGRFFLNSLVLVLFAALGQVFVSALVAYAFARLHAPGKSVLFMMLLSTMMIPIEVTMIPQFVLFKELGWLDSLLPLIVPNFFGGPYNIFLLRQFITRIPKDLDEAAQIDGLGYFGIFARIVLPLTRPALVAVAIFTFSFNWGWFMGPLIYVNSESKMPLALGVQILSATTGAGQTPPWNLVMVASLLLTIPMMLVYLAGQRYLYEVGVSTSSAIVR